MEQERNAVGAVTSVLLSGMIDFLAPLKWFALLGFVLIIVDLRFGVRAAKVRGETVRFSNAGRRTINKLVDYLCWILLAAAIHKALIQFDIPLLPGLVLLVIYGLEINSCYSNYFESRGQKIEVDFFSIFRKKTDIIEIKEEEKSHENTD
jgi:membrane protein required for beta-lactamase induction